MQVAIRAVVAVAAIALSTSAAAEYAGLDVGAPALAGQTATVSAGSAYDITAAGTDIQNGADQFHFAYRLQSGDFDLRVRVAALPPVNEWSKAGLMARESMHPGSRQVSVFATPAGGYEFQYRATAGGLVQKADSTARVSYPDTWVRLKRAGNVFTAYTSSDGFNWTLAGSRSLALAPTLFFGMAATSHDASQSVLAQYRDLSTVAPTGLDVGTPALAGQTTVVTAGSDYDVTAAGSDIYGTADQFHFTHRLAGPADTFSLQSGDFDVRVRVSSLTATQEWAKAGLMARESMHPGSRQVSVLATPAGGYEFQYRAATSGVTQKLDSTARVSYPDTWVRLRRVGNQFTAYTATDGLEWTYFGSTTLALPESLVLGFAATSHDATQRTVAQFRDHGRINPANDKKAPSAPGNLGAVAVSHSQINLSWTAATDNVGVVGYRVMRGGVQIAATSALAYADSGLSPSTDYTYTVAAFDAAGNVSAGATPASAVTQAPPDATAPTAPAALTATALSPSQIALAWSASSDNVGVVAYRVLRNGVQVGTTSALAYTDAGLASSTTHSYTVAAADAAGNVSAPSNAASATTLAPADTTAPSIPAGLAAVAASASQINLTWTPATDNVAVTGYKVMRGGVQIATTIAPAYADTGLAPATVYSYTVAAFDAAGNASAPSAAATAATPALPDTVAPTAPAGLSATASSSSQIALTWGAATDNVGVTGYNVLRNGVLIGGTSSLAYTDTGLAASTTYTYTVTAADAAGNVSAPSNPAAATTQQGASGNARSPLGTNLAAIADWSREWAFVDAFKTSRPWISGSSSAWDDGRALATDADGWVTSLQAGQIARTLLFWDLGGEYPAGTYTVLYDGQGSLQIGTAATVIDSQPGRIRLQVDPARGGITIYLTATTPGNHLRNVRVLMPGGICEGDPFRHAADAGACADAGLYRSFETHYAQIVFHPKFLASVRTYRALRFMDWGATNNSGQTAWSGRPKPGDARWSVKGVPVEVMVDLANRVGAHPWFTLPHRADNDYFAQYARLVRQTLRSELKAYVEYSNEVWNYQFAQADYARTQGLALGLSGEQYEAARRFYSKRSVELFNIWSAEFADPARLVRVMGSQAVNSWLSGELLDYQNARAFTDALAIAPYFGGHIQAGAATWTLNQLFADLQASMGGVISSMSSQKALAAARGVTLIAYEGGQHLVGHSGAENNTALNALLDAANRDPRMGALYRTYLDGWKASGAELLVHYYNAGAYSKWGRWGSLESLEQPRSAAPKFDALQTFIEENPASW